MCESCQSALVDRAMIDELRSTVGAKGADDLSRSFFREAQERLAALRLLTVAEAEAIRFQLHSVHGSAGMFGLTRLSALLRKLYDRSDALTPEAYGRAVDEIATTLAASCQALADLGTSPPSD